MNKIFWDLINTRKVAGFIDVIIVGTEEEEIHDEVVEEVVKRLGENDLYVKPGKCKQKARKVGFLGVVIGPERIKMEGEKVKEVLDQLTLKGVKNVQKFLGLVNYYQQFIEDFAVIVGPLQNLVKKNQKQNLAEKQEEVFKELKEIFTKELVLAAPDLDKKQEQKQMHQIT